jgi:hypothetical protein
MGIMMKRTIAGAVSAVAVIAAVTACSTTTTAVRTPAPKPTVTKTETAKPTPAVVKTAKPQPGVATPAPPATTPPAATTPATSAPTAAPAPGYLGDIFGGGTGNPCNFASGYQLGVCNPTGQTEQEYIDNPGGTAPGTATNSQGCYYVRMGEGYCPSTGQTIPMQDPNG